MTVYLILIGLLILQAACFSISKIRSNKLYCILAYFEILLIAGFRIPTGGDTQHYVDFYTYVTDISSYSDLNSGFEIGYNIYNYLLSRVFHGPQYIIFFSIAIINYLVFKYILENSKIVWLSIVLYITLGFLFSFMNTTRFAIACAILLCSIKYLENSNFLKFTIVVLIAFSFHFSAIFFILIYFFKYIDLDKKKNIILILVGTLALNYVFVPIFELIVQFHGRYSSYMNTGGQFYSSSFTNIIYAIQYLLLFIFCYYYNKGKRNAPIVGALVLALSCAIVSMKIMMMIRFTTMFGLTVVVLIANSLYKFRHTLKYYFFLLIILSITVLQVVIIFIYRPDWYLITPYRNILFENY